MEHIKDILNSYKAERINMSPVPIEIIDKLEFLKNPLTLLNPILFANIFTKRQIKILLFIARFSIGCRRSVANLKPSDFIEIGIYSSDIKSELLRLLEAQYIGWNKSTNNLWITEKLLSKSLTKQSSKVSEILSRNLVKH